MVERGRETRGSHERGVTYHDWLVGVDVFIETRRRFGLAALAQATPIETRMSSGLTYGFSFRIYCYFLIVFGVESHAVDVYG